MRKFILQECKRILIKKKISIIVILVVIMVGGLVSTLKTKPYEQQLKQAKAGLYNLKSTRDKVKTVKKKQSFEKDIKDYEDEIKEITSQLNITKNYDTSKLDEQIEALKKQNNPKNEYKISQLKYYKEQGIEKGDFKSLGVYKALSNLSVFSIFLPIILIVILNDIVSGEYSPNTIKNLIVKPISREKIVISKFIVSIIFNIGIVILSALIFLLEGGIYLGLSDYKLPFDVGAKYIIDKSLPLTKVTSQMKYVLGSRMLIPIVSAFIILTILIIVTSIAITSIIMFISTVTKNSVTSAICDTIIVVGSSGWYLFVCMRSNISAAKYGGFCKLIPLPYSMESVSVLSGDISQKLSSNISIPFILLICLFWLLIMMILSVYVFRKKDFD